MYREHFGLLRRPFEMTPDPAFLVLGDAHREGLATLVYGVQARKGFVLLTGEVGTGKTTLLHALLSQLDRNTLAAFIFNPRVEPLDFFRLLFDELGIEKRCATKAEYLIELNRFLIDRLARDATTLLIIDEAQNLSAEMLEEVRLLSNLETPTSKLLQIILVGQPELWDLLGQPRLRQLRQRIVLRHKLAPFDEEETAKYVNERLHLAGYTGSELFRKAALREVFVLTGGVPRLVNIVCDGALLAAFAHGRTTVGPDLVREVARDLDLGAPPLRTNGAGNGHGNGRRAVPAPGRAQSLKSGWLGIVDWLQRQTGGR
jgi:general secretion pathway protein A